jgi:hypothetical protein
VLNTNAPGSPWVESSPALGQITFDGAQHTPRVGDVVQMFFLDTTPTLPGVVVTEIEGTLEELVVIGEDGKELGKGAATYQDVSPDTWLSVSWSQPAATRVMAMRLRVVDALRRV